MDKSRLQITSVEKREPMQPPMARTSRRQEIQATMERMWHLDPQQFNPLRDCAQRKRFVRTLEALKMKISLEGKLVADLGCGAGDISRGIRDAGAMVHAVDVAGNALNQLKSHSMERIVPIQDCLPTTKLEDNTYDAVLCTEVIGYLKPAEYRLAFAELSRIVKPQGTVICSTSLDTNSDNALERFAALAETEFEIDQWILDYDLLWLKLCRFFETPNFYAQASKQKEMCEREGGLRRGLALTLFRINTSFFLGKCWSLLAFIANPIASCCRQSSILMKLLEKVSRFFWDESGVTHALFVGTRRQMTFPLPLNEIPKEMKHKRQVWE